MVSERMAVRLPQANGGRVEDRVHVVANGTDLGVGGAGIEIEELLALPALREEALDRHISAAAADADSTTLVCAAEGGARNARIRTRSLERVHRPPPDAETQSLIRESRRSFGSVLTTSSEHDMEELMDRCTNSGGESGTRSHKSDASDDERGGSRPQNTQLTASQLKKKRRRHTR